MSSLSKKCPHFHGVKLKWLKIGSHKDSCIRAHTHTYTAIWKIYCTYSKWTSSIFSQCESPRRVTLSPFTVKCSLKVFLRIYLYMFVWCDKFSLPLVHRFLFQEDFEEAVLYFLKAIEISKPEPRYVTAQKCARLCSNSVKKVDQLMPRTISLLWYCLEISTIELKCTYKNTLWKWNILTRGCFFSPMIGYFSLLEIF